MSETFQQWWHERFPEDPKGLMAEIIWNHQQSKIDRLTERLKEAERVLHFAKMYICHGDRNSMILFEEARQAYDELVKEEEK